MFEWYFRTRWFEKNGFIYYVLGAKIFARYWPNKYTLHGFHFASLNDLAGQTRALEITHLILIIPILLLMFLRAGDLLWVCVFGSSNLFGNVLPIMSQRYIRARINFILLRKKAYRFW